MGFFSNPRKATKAFLKDPVRIVTHDVRNIARNINGEVNAPSPVNLPHGNGTVKPGLHFDHGKVDGAQVRIKVNL